MTQRKKNFIAIQLKSLLEFYFWLSMEGGAIVLSHYSIIHPCNDFYWWSYIYLYHQEYFCTLKRIHIKDRNVCIYVTIRHAPKIHARTARTPHQAPRAHRAMRSASRTARAPRPASDAPHTARPAFRRAATEAATRGHHSEAGPGV